MYNALPHFTSPDAYIVSMLYQRAVASQGGGEGRGGEGAVGTGRNHLGADTKFKKRNIYWQNKVLSSSNNKITMGERWHQTKSVQLLDEGGVRYWVNAPGDTRPCDAALKDIIHAGEKSS